MISFIFLGCCLSIVLDLVGVQQNCYVPLDVSGGESKITMVDRTAKRGETNTFNYISVTLSGETFARLKIIK